MIARAGAMLCLGGVLVQAAACAYGVVPIEEQSSPKDAGKDSHVVMLDASPAMDTSTADPPDTSVVPDSAPMCTAMLTSGNPTCDACATKYCCSQDNACAKSADCSNLINCYTGCSDATCMTACDSTYPSGSALLNAWGMCIQTSCATDCR